MEEPQRRPREQLIARRIACELSQEDVAAALDVDVSTIKRLEQGITTNGLRGKRRKLAEVLDNWPLDDLSAALSDGDGLPRPEQGWWSNYETLEQAAKKVRTLELVVVPGLLQAKGYASALFDIDERQVRRRMQRQRMVTRTHDPVQLAAILDESILRRRIGGRDVLTAQLRHLATMARRPNVSIQILPEEAGVEAAALSGTGPFVVLEFPWPGGLVYQQRRKGASYFDSPHDLEAHIATFDRLADLALTEDDSVMLIEHQAATELERS